MMNWGDSRQRIPVALVVEGSLLTDDIEVGIISAIANHTSRDSKGQGNEITEYA